MVEWLALILLVPVVVVPLVLLFGFAGCGFSVDVPDPYDRTFEVAFTDNDEQPDQCLVQRIESAALYNDGARIRIWVERATSGDLVIHRAFISNADDTPGANPYDSAADPTPVPLSAALVVPVDPNHGLVALPDVVFTLDRLKPLLLSFDIGSAGSVRFVPVPKEEGTAYFGPKWDASNPQHTAGYSPKPCNYLVKRIDIVPEGDA